MRGDAVHAPSAKQLGSTTAATSRYVVSLDLVISPHLGIYGNVVTQLVEHLASGLTSGLTGQHR